MYKKFSRIVIIAIFGITCLFIYFASQINFEYDFESFFSTKDDDLAFYQEFRDQFENDNDFLLIGIHNKEGVFTPSFIKKIDQLTDSLKALPDVEDVQSPTTIKNPVISMMGGFSMVPYIHTEDLSRIKKDSAYIYRYDELIGSFFSEDGEHVAVFVRTTNMIKREASETLLTNIEQLTDSHDFDEVHIAGKIKAEQYYIDRMKIELAIFVSSSILLIILFLWISFRAAWGVILPMIVVLLAVTWCLGAMGLSGRPIDLMTVLMPTIMFVVGMSDVVHIISRYLEELRYGRNKIKAIKTAFKEVGLATLLTSFTTAIGFLTLITSGIRPIQNFGIFTAIGVFLAFILAFTLLPAALINLKKPAIASTSTNKLFWHRHLLPFYGFILKKRHYIAAGAALVLFLSLYGVSQIKVDVRLIDEVQDGDPLKEDFLYFENHFTGVRPFEMAVMVKDSSKNMFSPEVLKEIDKVESYLTSEYGVNRVGSPATVVRMINRALNGGVSEYTKLPETKQGYRKVKRFTDRFTGRDEFDALVTNNQMLGRISGRMEDIGSARTSVKNEKLRAFIRENIDQNLVDMRITGSALLIDKNNESLSVNMMQGLGIAFGVIALIMGLLYRSLKIVFISLIPNIIPLLMIGGIMGFTGIDLKISTSIIFTIAFGIAVDDTIHFMSKLKLEINKGKSLLYAIKRTFLSTGKAIIVTSIILVGGFLTLIMSSFNGTFYTGLLVSLTLLFAVIADLLLIPVLLVYFYRPKKKNDKLKEN